MPLTIRKIPRPFKHLASLTELVRFFTPNWFAVTMGTGVLALVLAQAVAASSPLFVLARTLWLINGSLFVLFSLLYGARWLFYPQEACKIFQHPQMSMFLGTIPMGLATVINGFINFGVPMMGDEAIVIAHSLWMLDAILAILCGAGLPLFMFTRQSHNLSSMTGLWLLPIVTAEVAAASGWIIAPHLSDIVQQRDMVIFNMLLWAFSVPIALSILVILLLRMALHKLPPIALSATTWLALGPIGTGALGMFLLSQQSELLSRDPTLAGYSHVIAGIGWMMGILLWGVGAWWFLIALGVTFYYVKRGIPFNLGWWGYIFPLGVFTLATFKLAQLTAITFFSSLSVGFLLLLASLWIIVMAKTLRGAWSGQLFFSPCLQDSKHTTVDLKENL
ncbi:TDT family transporter [Rosenbergiella australiborealis]|uniref:TDT family transporter n=1 Tax=Rosenbergiella australiborealis TaxID=1544696 RepID=A0ABS5T568_9GAMM|nr:TDT family transporter [Rosenbergiella australiborealis]MBT0727486.1 TDT family transporter [Rosenbergiella australiborealis]